MGNKARPTKRRKAGAPAPYRLHDRDFDIYDPFALKLLDVLVAKIPKRPILQTVAVYWGESVPNLLYLNSVDVKAGFGSFDPFGESAVEVDVDTGPKDTDTLYAFHSRLIDETEEERIDEDAAMRIAELFEYWVTSRLGARLGVPAFSVNHDNERYFNKPLWKLAQQSSTSGFSQFVSECASVTTRESM